MLKIQMANGETLTLDLCIPEQAAAWSKIENDVATQKDIRAIGIVHDKMWHVLPAPKKFKRINYEAWITTNGGQQPASLRVLCHADDIDIRMVLYYPHGTSPRMVRTDIKKVGRQVFQPEGIKQ